MGVIFIHVLTLNRDIFIPLTDASQGAIGFVDFRQARVYWASGTMAGGFARLCRTEDSLLLKNFNTSSSRNLHTGCNRRCGAG